MLPSFFTPWAFFGFLAVPALLAIYWLRTRSRPVVVSSLMLWLDQSEVRTGGFRFELLKTPLLFLLELLAIVCLVLAAASPWLQTAKGAQALVIVLDDSFSMLAGGRQSPRERAEDAARDGLPERQWYGVQVILAGERPQVLGEPVATAGAALPLLDRWRCSSPAADLEGAIALAGELGGAQARVLVLTDHPPDFAVDKGRVRWWAFGKPEANVAITGAARTSLGDAERCLLEVTNHGGAARTVELSTRRGDREAERTALTLQPAETRRLVLGWERPAGGGGEDFEAWLPDDALPIDNRVALLDRPPPLVRVEIDVADKGLQAHVTKAVQATGQVLLTDRAPHLQITDRAGAAGSAPSWALELIAEPDAEAFLGPFLTDRGHPLTQGLSLDGVVWGAGKDDALPGSPVVLAGNTPLLTDAAGPSGAHRIRLRLRPELSTLTELPAWPVLLWNLVRWRAGELPGPDAVNLRLGESATVAADAAAGPVTVSGPGGGSAEVPVRDGRAVVRPEAVGVYALELDGAEYRLACNALSRAESDLSGAGSGAWGEWGDDLTVAGFTDLTWLLLLAALACLSAHLFLVSRLGARS